MRETEPVADPAADTMRDLARARTAGDIRRVHVVINPAAGQDAPVLAALNEAWKETQIDWSVSLTHRSGDGRDRAREALDQGFDLIGVVGGDGTVAEVAATLAATDVPLAILPGGTGNSAAQEFGIPLDLVEAARVATRADARVMPVDVLRVGEHASLLRVGVGFEASAVTGATRELKDQLGWFAYPITALREFGAAEPARFELELDGRQSEIDAFAIVVANVGRIGRAGARFPGGVDPCDGLADVFLLRSMDLSALVAVGARFLRLSQEDGGTEDDPLIHLQARNVQIRCSDRSFPAHADGEPCGETPLEIGTRAGELQLLLPPETGSEDQA